MATLEKNGSPASSHNSLALYFTVRGLCKVLRGSEPLIQSYWHWCNSAKAASHFGNWPSDISAQDLQLAPADKGKSDCANL